MSSTPDMDKDIAAIRAMMAGCEESPATPPAAKKRRVLKAPAPKAPQNVAETPTPQPARTPRGLPLVKRAARAIGRYRPNRRAILWTSLVLLLLLQPFWVMGALLATVLCLMIAFVALGAEGFWRRVLAVFALYARWFPHHARVSKARGWLAARKWDALVARVPGRWADSLRAPDLSRVAKAEQRHDAVLADRLSRLQDEAAT